MNSTGEKESLRTVAVRDDILNDYLEERSFMLWQQEQTEVEADASL